MFNSFLYVYQRVHHPTWCFFNHINPNGPFFWGMQNWLPPFTTMRTVPQTAGRAKKGAILTVEILEARGYRKKHGETHADIDLQMVGSPHL